ncbi:MAG: transporter [Verrucomicrobia bacterium]|nr:transporter [Verrucomicrobiota bacterium]
MLRHLALLSCLPALLAAGEPSAADAEKASPSKAGYTLFNPTPTALLRDLSTDRPDTTEGAVTVDAGHYQLELSFLDYTRNRDSDGVRTTTSVIAPFNLRVGLTNRVEFNLIFEPYVIARTRTPGLPTETLRGQGDLTLRMKVNFWGNDGPEPGFGKTAFGIIPFLKIPTARSGLGNGRVEGGVILPISFELPADFGLSFMAEGDIVRDASNRRYGFEFVHTASLGRKLVGDLNGYVEYVGVAPTRTESTYRAFFSAGLTYALGKNSQFDVGARFGLNKASDDVNLFTGFSIRY